MMYSKSSAKRRGLSVWHTAPMPMIPYQHSRCRRVFQQSVATLSPGLHCTRVSAPYCNPNTTLPSSPPHLFFLQRKHQQTDKPSPTSQHAAAGLNPTGGPTLAVIKLYCGRGSAELT